jgi:hypothetical protein
MKNKFRLLLLLAVPGAPLVGLGLWALSNAVAAGAAPIPIVTAHAPEMVTTNKGLFLLDTPDKKAPDYARKIMEIYGTPSAEPEPVLFVPPGKLSTPEEDRSISFLLVGKDGVQEPVQAKTVTFFGKLLVKGSVVAAAFFAVANLLVLASSPAAGGRSAAAD